MRTFIAINVPENIRNIIGSYQSVLKKEKARVSWVKPDNIHITLKFLGEVEEKKISEIYEALKKCILGRKIFDVEITGAGGFPNLTKPRVIWVGLSKGTEELKSIAKSIDIELESLGFEREERDFKAHLTIGRVKRITPEFIQKLKSTEFKGGSFTAEGISVMKSDLKPTGAVYTKLHALEFASI